jgi:hypothetical protein
MSSKRRERGKPKAKRKRRARDSSSYLKIEGDPTAIIKRMLATPPRRRATPSK